MSKTATAPLGTNHPLLMLKKDLEASLMVDKVIVTRNDIQTDYSLDIYPVTKDCGTTKKLKALVNQTIGNLGVNCKLIKTLPSKRKYRTLVGQRICDGWTYPFWQFELTLTNYPKIQF